jgi:hypothetical protein
MAFSTFFALASANLVDFSALTLAVVAASKAFWEASSSASSDEIRALAVVRASAVHQGGKEKSRKKQRKAYRTSKYRKRNLPSEALAAFRYSTHSLPKVTNFFIMFYPEIVREYQHAKVEVNIPVYSRTSSMELVDSWASREAPASDDFFTCLELRTSTTFLTGFLGAFGDFTARLTSCDGGSSTTGVSMIGAAAANLFGFSSSLRKRAKDKVTY